jgi:GntR family transcriptional regulator
MEPRPTAVKRPIHLQIADDIRIEIESGALQPGSSLPTLAELCRRYDCSMNSARGAINLLRSQGLITAGRGKAPIVRIPPGKVVRDSERHQAEKDLAARPEAERAKVGEAETNLGMSIEDQRFTSTYDLIPATDELAELFEIDPEAPVLRRKYEAVNARGRLLSYSVSYIPKGLIDANPALLDESNEPWPGGTQHQLSTVGIEIMCIVDQVTARMPTTVEVQLWDLPAGVPLIFCRRISLDANNRTVEISDADYPADRTELRFTTRLKPWRRRDRSPVAAKAQDASKGR